jgi:putative two-component system response regulator
MVQTVFVMSDNETTLSRFADVIKREYAVEKVKSAAQLRELLSRVIPALILLDIDIAGTSGVDALQYVQSDYLTMRIPVVLLTDKYDPAVDDLCMVFGAVDYLTRCVSTDILLHCIKAHIRLNKQITIQAARLSSLQNSIVSVMAELINHRDSSTGGHIVRTSAYLRILVIEMMRSGVYGADMHNWRVDTVIPSARLHDVGKIAIPDAILNKPGKLDEQEYAKMQTHTSQGENIISTMTTHAGDGAFLTHARLFAGYHHEKWDGTGYPRKLRGLDIPLEGRILAVADVYDALVSTRPYKKPFSHEVAEAIIISEAGRHFDPLVVDAFTRVIDQFRECPVEETISPILLGASEHST